MLVIVFVHKSGESRILAVSRRAFYIVAVDILVSVCGTRFEVRKIHPPTVPFLFPCCA